MSKVIKIMIIVLSLIILLTVCEKGPIEPRDDNLPGGDNTTNAGKPYHIRFISVPDDQIHIAFGLIGDTHSDASYAGWIPFSGYPYRDTDNIKNNRYVATRLNTDAGLAGCLGIIHLGDMGNTNNAQNLIAFRQIFERSYPGYDGGSIAGVEDNHYNAYSQGKAIEHKTVFPTIGNHDCPEYGDDPKWWRTGENYIKDLISGADGIISCYDNAMSGAYAWRWGQYFFIQLGLWAGSGENQSHTFVDTLKLRWFENFLEDNVGDSGAGVIICQHYGFDDFSEETRWWTSEMRKIEVDILCRRDWTLPDSLQGPADPYNVICIFSGHYHRFDHHHVGAGYDADNNHIVFDNICINDAEGDGSFGYSIVTLTGTEALIHTWDSDDDWHSWNKTYSLDSE